MLTVAQLKASKPRKKQYKIFDERGLFLIVRPNGNKWWRFRYRFDGAEKLLSLGVYPDVSLKDARLKRDEARNLVANGVDPSQHRKQERIARQNELTGTFKAIAEEWLDAGCPGSLSSKGAPSQETIRQLRSRLTKYVYPRIGHMPLNDMTLSDVRGALKPITRQGKLETAHRVRALCERVWRYAIQTERATRNIPADLRGTLPPVGDSGGFAAITEPREFGKLLASIDGYEGNAVTIAALKLAPLVFLRPIELRAAEWAEVDYSASKWSLPAGRMKERREHVVPLSKQAKKVLSDLFRITGQGKYLFPSVRTKSRPMSDNTLNAALRRLGYSTEEQTAHGFRKSASTLLHELGFAPEWIEAQLAHKLPGVAGVYNKAAYLPDRGRMMQRWADYCDELKASKQ